MHQSLNENSIEQIIHTDICIVGSIAAGIPLALELDKRSKSVLLIESGGFEFDSDIQKMNKGENIGQNIFHYNPADFVFGGTTGHWTGQCSTLDEIDFEKREWVENSGWPISKSDP